MSGIAHPTFGGDRCCGQNALLESEGRLDIVRIALRPKGSISEALRELVGPRRQSELKVHSGSAVTFSAVTAATFPCTALSSIRHYNFCFGIEVFAMHKASAKINSERVLGVSADPCPSMEIDLNEVSRVSASGIIEFTIADKA